MFEKAEFSRKITLRNNPTLYIRSFNMNSWSSSIVFTYDPIHIDRVYNFAYEIKH